jgi:hypothetical protein
VRCSRPSCRRTPWTGPLPDAPCSSTWATGQARCTRAGRPCLAPPAPVAGHRPPPARARSATSPTRSPQRAPARSRNFCQAAPRKVRRQNVVADLGRQRRQRRHGPHRVDATAAERLLPKSTNCRWRPEADDSRAEPIGGKRSFVGHVPRGAAEHGLIGH